MEEDVILKIPKSELKEIIMATFEDGLVGGYNLTMKDNADYVSYGSEIPKTVISEEKYSEIMAFFGDVVLKDLLTIIEVVS